MTNTYYTDLLTPPNVVGKHVVHSQELSHRRFRPSAFAVYNKKTSLRASVYVTSLCVLPTSPHVFDWRHTISYVLFVQGDNIREQTLGENSLNVIRETKVCIKVRTLVAERETISLDVFF